MQSLGLTVIQTGLEFQLELTQAFTKSKTKIYDFSRRD